MVKTATKVVVFGWLSAFALDALLTGILPDEYRLGSDQYVDPGAQFMEGALYFSVIFCLWQAFATNADLGKRWDEIPFLEVVAGIGIGLFVVWVTFGLLFIGIALLPATSAYQQYVVAGWLERVGLFECGAIIAIAEWVWIDKKFLAPKRNLENVRKWRPGPPLEPPHPPQNPPPPNTFGGNDMPPERQLVANDNDNEGAVGAGENLQHLDAGLVNLSFLDLAAQLSCHSPRVAGQPFYRLIEDISRQRARIDQQRNRLLAAISNAENANNHQFIQRAQQILEKIQTTNHAILSPIEFPTAGLLQDLAAYTRKLQLLSNKIKEFLARYSRLSDELVKKINAASIRMERERDVALNALAAVRETEADQNNEDDLANRIDNFDAMRDRLNGLEHDAVSNTTSIKRCANDTREKITTVLPSYFSLLNRLQDYVDAPDNAAENDRIQQENNVSTEALENAIVAYKDAIDTGDAFLIEEKLQQLADELLDISIISELPRSHYDIEALTITPPAGDFWRYGYILETPHNLDIFLDELMSETGSWVSMPTTAEPQTQSLDELERALSEIENQRWQLEPLFGQVHL